MGTAQTAEDARLETAVVAYLALQKHWQRDQYRLERKGVDDQGNAVVWAVFLEDELHPKPGGGQSVDLRVEPGSYRVVKELHWQ